MDKRKLIKNHAAAMLVIFPVITALLVYALCIGFLQIINADKGTAICISKSIAGLSGIVVYVVIAFYMVRKL